MNANLEDVIDPDQEVTLADTEEDRKLIQSNH